eukprot:bmy_09892T0
MVGPLSEQQQKIQNKKKPTGSKPLLLFCGDGVSTPGMALLGDLLRRYRAGTVVLSRGLCGSYFFSRSQHTDSIPKIPCDDHCLRSRNPSGTREIILADKANKLAEFSETSNEGTIDRPKTDVYCGLVWYPVLPLGEKECPCIRAASSIESSSVNVQLTDVAGPLKPFLPSQNTRMKFYKKKTIVFTKSLCSAAMLAMKNFHSQDHTSDFLSPLFSPSLKEKKDEVALRKSKLTTEDIQGKNCLTNFHGMDLTHEKMCSMVKRMADHD